MKRILLFLSTAFYLYANSQALIIGRGPSSVDSLIGVDTDLIIETKREELKTMKALETPVFEPIMVNKRIRFKENIPVAVNVLYDNPTFIEFRDSMRNLMEIKWMGDVGGSDGFSVSSVAGAKEVVKNGGIPGRLSITPTRVGVKGTLTVGLEGLDYPVTIRFIEGQETYSPMAVIEVEGAVMSAMGGTYIDRLKMSLLQDAVTLDNLESGRDKLVVEVYDLSDSTVNGENTKPKLFGEELIRAYEFKDGKNIYIGVVLHDDFTLEANRGEFVNYRNDYRVYLLDHRNRVLTINSHKKNERYRVVIR